MTTVIIRTAFDAFNNEDNAPANYGDSAKISMRLQTAHHRYGFVHFPLGVPAGATVTSAVLTVFLRSAWSGTTTMTASRITEKWRESTVSYTVPNNGGPNRTVTHAATAVVTSGIDKQAVNFDVTTIAQDWFTGIANYGLRLETDTTAISNLYSSDAADPTLTPLLTLTYVLPPDPPTNLRPNGTRAVSGAHPLLLWDSDTPAQVQVQLDNNSDFSSPLIDHGYQASVQQQYDTAPDTALTNNTTYYWRVRIKDANGVASDWSDVADFAYQTLAATTITVPTNGGTVKTPTPTISHTLGGGRTQAYVSYTLTENGIVVYTREKVPDVATDFVLPSGFVRDTAAAYAINVKVWDTLNREVVGPALDYSEDTNAFTLVLDNAVAPVTNLAVTQVNGHVHVVWQRTTNPDYFVLRVDGVIVQDTIDPADVQTSSQHFAMDFYRATPWGAASIYEVLAQSSNILSGSNPTASLAFQPTGLWLVDETTGDEVVVWDKDAVSTDIGESGATFFLRGQRAPVRVTDSIRGLEGNLSGRLVTTPTMTVAAAHAAFLRIKGAAARTFRLVYGHRNIPVVFGQAHDELDTTPEESYLIKLDFAQVGEFQVPWV